MAERDWEQNNELNFNPQSLTLGSHKKVWWKCNKGHEWQAQLANRNYGNGCPYCAGQWAIQGETDLETNDPLLASEW